MKRVIDPPEHTWSALLARPFADDAEILPVVRDVLRSVRAEGDAAVRKYEQRFGHAGERPFRITPEELHAAAAQVPEALKRAIATAQGNIERFHATQLERSQTVETMPGVECWRRSVPLDSVGLYIPGGTAPLFSTVLMLGVPARLAGCPRIVLCSPAGADGLIHPAVLYSAQLLGIHEVYRVGGAQVVAAMAYGTASIPRVNKILGPGNRYVDLAKRLVAFEGIAIDLPAGPSEVAVLADGTSDPAFVAADLLSQAEHGADSQVLLVTTDVATADAVQQELDRQLKRLPRAELAAAALDNSRCVIMHDQEAALRLLNTYAPEHLILATADAERIIDRVRNAGSVFIGPYSCESAGDYASGTNHTLPTNGHARAFAGVSVDSFVKKITFQRITRAGLEALAPTIIIMADAEGLQAHAEAVRVRINTSTNA